MILSETNKIRVSNTIHLAVVVGVVLAGASYFKVPGNILVLKILVVPMFWLSLLGLKALYKEPIENQPVFSANVIEYNALYVFLFSTFLFIVCWTPTVELWQILVGAIAAFSIGFPLSLYLHHKNLN